MINVLSKFKNNRLLTSFSVLVSGTIIAQAIGILLSPIITRLFTPEEMGIYTMITTAVSLFGPIICMKYDMAIIVSKDKEEEYSLIKLSCVISIILSLLFSIVYTIFIIKGENIIFSIFSFISILILLLCYGINNILIAFNNKNLEYKLMSSVTIIKSWVSNIFMLISGLLNLNTFGLIISQILGYLVGVKRQSTILIKDINMLKQINIYEMKKVLSKYKKQALYNTPSAFSTALIYSSINVFIKMIYSIEVLGLYSLSYRVLGIPFSLISANISRIFFESASRELNEHKKFENTFKKVSLMLFIIVIPTIILLAIIAPQLFLLVFGNKWSGAGLYVRLLAPMFAIRLIVESLTTSFIAGNKQQKELMFYISLLLGEFIIYLIVFMFNLNIKVLLILISLLYVIIYSLMYVYMLKMSKEKNKNY